jgi:hypothetical protein
MSKWKNKNGKTVRRNSVAEHFASRPVELIASPALRVISRHAHLALSRIELELRQHAGRCNGRLIVTTLQFIEYGIERRRIPAALRELEALGIIVIAHGRGGNAEHRQPNRFLLNYLCGAVDAHELISDTCKRFKALEEAEKIAAGARKAKDPSKVSYSQKITRRKNSQVPKVYPGPGTKSVPEAPNFSGTKSVPTSPGTKSVPTSEISGGGGEVGGLSVNGAATPAHAPIGHNAGPPLEKTRD